ncbi:transcriptional regulator, AraC family [Flavobacterium cauense R2A-7]|uniref:Helix-turn-helix protein n=1 Tax=Flavobacterium cauense R2A-7 TaxID=1341154 RepID=V6S3I6_9FLAO|nr:AraC family transcriptional regulator [Flavobacterium cauense]ESU20984.1 transcriptional regulator, AraC family [Flavobacterium cauense R2A-7]KGO79600.1 AraC family transcriptional regulator [Flavobacterium cauense R2A-7]TWI08348.1 helix-turn-helix protein [Flavobacterium cauense R2A-7]
MKAFLKFDFNVVTKKLLEEKLEGLGVKFNIVGFGEVEFLETLKPEKMDEITLLLNSYGIEVIENQKSILVQKIKDLITEMVFQENNPNVKSSVYLAEKLNHSYGYLSNLFSEVTYTSIENYIILQKIELAKQLIVNDKLSLTEIAYKLNYSSVAHLSTQFKNTTGITPTAFQRIIERRRKIANEK